MRKPFKMRGNPFKRNFGIGPGLSPYKAEEEKTEEKKPEIVENVVGGDKEKGDKGWRVSVSFNFIQGNATAISQWKNKTR